MEEPIYLDNGTLARPSDYLFNQMTPFSKRHWHAVTAPYLQGKEPFTSINRSLDTLRTFLGAGKRDLLHFCPSGGHAISEVYHSAYADHIAQNGKNHILTTDLEEAPIHLLGEQFEKLGLFQKKIPLNEKGQVTRENLEKALSPKTGLVSLSWANALTGVIHPIWELAELCKEKGILFHIDASAILGKLYFKFEELPIDYLTFEGTMIHGPKGSGTLLVKRGVDFTLSVPEGMEGTDLNVAALVGLGIATQELDASFDHLCMETARLRDHLEEGIVRAIPEATVHFKEAERLPNTTVISFPGVTSELLTFHLKERGVFASFGGGRHQKLEHLLAACGIEGKSALSFTLSRDTTEEEINRAIGHIVDAAQKCRTFSNGVAL
ncbi:aminotransferase class V-fold PLP-dependent enzyme [Candidatus Neptunochlamydia vexilliferae]|uniref:aminotransferase class V-fold PLP-dependent enzyme n=1 Tax=Candidatus Neptunichlamydia vexilliferae TaxID=1651774 RepID=UPI0018910A4E|nr:aminotransferase class V-fold PLP-dependent enzyme [Candidatus Neptunochlamydia vexilliferae]